MLNILKAETKVSTGCICAGYLVVLIAAVYIIERIYGASYGFLVGEFLLAAVILARGIYEAATQHKPALLYAGLLLLVLGFWALGLMLSSDPSIFGAFLALGAGIGWIIFGIIMWIRGH